MWRFRWDETDLIEYLGVIPTIDEDLEGRHFAVVRNGLRLHLSIYDYNGEVGLSLSREGAERPLFGMLVRGCPGVRLVRNRERPDYLEFDAPSGDGYDGEPVSGMGMRLAVDPDISVELF